MDHERSLVTCEQLISGESIGGGHQVSGPVLADLKQGEVAAFGLSGMSGRLIMAAGGQEVAGRAARGGNRVGFTFADLVDVHAVESGGQNAGGNRIHGDGDVAAGEIESRRGDGLAVWRFQLGGQRFATGRRAARRGTRRPALNRGRGARLGARVLR